jgi:hypothetical protein
MLWRYVLTRYYSNEGERWEDFRGLNMEEG